MYDIKKIQKEIENFWKENKIYEKLFKRDGKNYSLLDGPPYANAPPHTGHIKNTVFKDLAIRWAFMKGFRALFKPGFDTHGLPIENKIEKKLKLNSKKDIENFGIQNFMEECKKEATSNKDLWMDVYEKIGSLYSLKEPYLTYSEEYVQGAWWAFSQMYKKGLVYEGEKPVMWCPHCETALAGYEVTDSYKDVEDPGIYVLFKLKDSDEYLLVYTTTPWTLPANVAIAVASKENYVLVEIKNKKIILAEKRLEKLKERGINYKILNKFKGKELVGKKYEPLLDVPMQNEIKSSEKKSHEVIASIPILKERTASKIKTKKDIKDSKDLFEEFVTVNEGTGFVHVAPGHGNTDFLVGKHYNLAIASPVNDKGEFIKEKAGFSGFVKKADKKIIEKLKMQDKLLFQEDIIHSYPLCWRCKSPLIFRLSKQLFFKIESIKNIMIDETKKVKWMPGFAKERFENWVRQAEDWNISRQRYWGIPIPLWKSDDGDEIIIESKEQLEKFSGKKILDLHNVDEIVFEKEGKQFKKVKGILDVWFDSGVAPWASMGYPFKSKKLFETSFPVDRINEAQDQIRGWFYSLMFCSVGVFNKAPYKGVSMIGWVLDAKGQKMSKSLGNVISGEEAVDELGADILRYYFCWDIAPYEVQKFNMQIAKKEVGRVFNVLWNLQNLINNEELRIKTLKDKWIISKLNKLIKEYKKNIENFETHIALRSLSDFILNDLSRTYIRMTREQENQGGIIKYCLVNLLKLIAPVSPFISEKIWQNLRKKKIVESESIHFEMLPEGDENLINKELEKEFSEIFEFIEKGLAERDKEKIGLRWPLSKVILYTKKRDIINKYKEIILEQLNVKDVLIEDSSEEKIKLDTELTSELEAEGYAREISRKIQFFRKKKGLNKEDTIKLELFLDKDFRKIIEKNLSLIQERTNFSEIIFSEYKAKEKFKNIEDFKIKDKKGGIKIITN